MGLKEIIAPFADKMSSGIAEEEIKPDLQNTLNGYFDECVELRIHRNADLGVKRWRYQREFDFVTGCPTTVDIWIAN